MLKKLKKYKTVIFLVGVFLSSLPIAAVLSKEGFFTMHDNVQIARVFEMQNALLDGQFPVRMVKDLGYGLGYPLFNFYAPLPYYIGAFFSILTGSIITGSKIMIYVGFLLSGFCMFLFARKLWGNSGGLLSSLLYMYAPYHAVQIFVRGSIGELWAYAMIPLVFVGIYNILKSKIKNKKLKINTILIGAVGFTGVILSHNITAMMLGIFLMLFILFYSIYEFIVSKTLHRTAGLVGMVLLGLGLSAFYWLPALLESSFTSVSKIIGGSADFRLHFLYLDQLWDSAWGYAGSAPGRADGMSFKIGKLHIILFLLGCIGIFKINKKHKILSSKKFLILYIFTILFLSIFLTLNQSEPVWHVVSIFNYIQYPWRFLVIILFSISVAAGASVYLFNNFNHRIVFVLFVSGVVIGLNVKYFKPQHYVLTKEESYKEKEYLLWTASKISDEYLPKDSKFPQNYSEVPSTVFEIEKGEIISEINKSNYKSANVSVFAEKGELKINITYFPGWELFINNTKINRIENSILSAIPLEKGTYAIDLKFNNTPLRLFANLVSLVSVLIFGTIILFKFRHEKKKS
jgi:hypothetical protein